MRIFTTIYQAGFWSADPQEMAQNVYYFETSDDDPETGIGPTRSATGHAFHRAASLSAAIPAPDQQRHPSLIAITFDRYRALPMRAALKRARH